MSNNLVGTTLAKHRIQRLLGQGGMGTVYEAIDLNLDRVVALKVMNPTLGEQESFQRRFQQEARALARLNHNHIVKVYAADSVEKHLFLVMEFVDGGSVRDLLERLQDEQKLPPFNEVIDLILQVADALHYAHQQGMVHRDIKPDNVLLRWQEREGVQKSLEAVVTDFGLAKLATSDFKSVVGQPMGTPAYMSPEQCLESAVDERTDIYALGVMLFELLVGRLPYMPESISHARRIHENEEPLPKPTEFRPELPASLEQVIVKCLKKSPDDRYRTADEMARALREIKQTLAMEEAVTEIPLETPLPPEKADGNTVSITQITPPPQTEFTPPLTQKPASLANQDCILIVSKTAAMWQAITKARMSIGRTNESDITLDSQGVSRLHLHLERREDGSYWITDLGSRNGTWINNTRLVPNTTVRWEYDQKVKIGYFSLELIRGSEQDETEEIESVIENLIVSSERNMSAVVSPKELIVAPGNVVTFNVDIEVLGGPVDHFAIDVEGLPREWVRLSPKEVQLIPEVKNKGTVVVTIQPPKVSSTTAGTRHFNVTVKGKVQPHEVIVERCTLKIEEFSSTTLKLYPTQLQGKRKTNLTIINGGNAPFKYNLSASDDANEVNIRFIHSQVRVEPGEKREVPIILSRRRLLVGNQEQYSFHINVEPEETDETLQPKQGTLIVRPLLPAWLLVGMLPVCGFIAIALISGLLNFMHDIQVTQTAVAAQITQTHEATENEIAHRQSATAQTATAESQQASTNIAASSTAAVELRQADLAQQYQTGTAQHDASLTAIQRTREAENLLTQTGLSTLIIQLTNQPATQFAENSTATAEAERQTQLAQTRTDQANREATQQAQQTADALTRDAHFTATVQAQQTATARAVSDDDGDELTYARELQHGTDPNNPDSDGDGLLDGEEVDLYDTDPLRHTEWMDVYNFLDNVSNATWTNGSGDVLAFPCIEGESCDHRGFVRIWEENTARLQDGTSPRWLETHPEWIENWTGEITGIFSEPIRIHRDDVFIAGIGLREGAFSGGADWELGYISNTSQDCVSLHREYREYNNSITAIEFDLSELRGQTVRFCLKVYAGVSASQDHAAWIYPRIEGYRDIG